MTTDDRIDHISYITVNKKLSYPHRPTGDRLRALREKTGLSQEKVGEIVGVTQQTIAYYETGKKFPRKKTLKELATLYEVTIDFLMDQSDNPQEDPWIYRNDHHVISMIHEIDLLRKDQELEPSEQDQLIRDAKEYLKYRIEQAKKK